MTGVARTTVYEGLKKLMEKGDIKSYSEKKVIKRGRSYVYFGLSENVNDEQMKSLSLTERIILKSMTKETGLNYPTVYSALHSLEHKKEVDFESMGKKRCFFRASDEV